MKSLTLLVALLLCCAPFLSAQNTIFVVRHAEKVAASGDDAKDPELSPAGQARAAALAEMLKDAQVTAIFATEYKRTQQTAEPLARSANIEVTVKPAKDTPALVARLKEIRGNTLVIGHSNTITDILKALGAQVSFTIGDDDYDNFFVVSCASEPQLSRLRFPAPAAPASR